MIFSAAAPGKIFLLGEYSVLEGYGALIGAVNRLALARFAPDADRLQIKSGLWQGARSVSDLRLEGETSRAVAGVGAALEFLGECDLPRGTLTLDSSALFEGERKLGFGSSAAVVVATMGAIVQSCGTRLDAAFRERAFAIAKKWHNAAQGTQGSGGDVAASLCGAVTHLNGDGGLASVAPVGAMGVFVHAQSASTPSFVRALRAWALSAPEEYRDHLNQLGTLTALGVAALYANATEQWLAVVREADAALGALSTAAALPIVTPRHRLLASLVESFGGACKPAGAGGGDLSLVVARDRVHLALIKKKLAEKNFKLEPLVLSARGLHGKS